MRPSVALRIDARDAVRRLRPSRPRLVVEHVGQRAAGPLGLGKRADAASRSFGTSARKMRAVVTASPSAEWRSDDLDAEPGGKLLERVAGQFGRGDLGEQPGVERARPATRQARRARIPASAPRDRSRPCGRSRRRRPRNAAEAAARPRRKRGASRDHARRRCRGLRVALAGIGLARSHQLTERIAGDRACRPTAAPPRSRSTRALRGSRPVVSVSMTTASSAAAGRRTVGPSRLRAARAQPDQASAPRAVPVARAARPCARSIRHGCCTAQTRR